MSPDCHPIVGRWTAADTEMKQIVLLGDRWLLFSGAHPGIFVGERGIQPSKKKPRKKPQTQKGRGRALQYLFCINTVEI